MTTGTKSREPSFGPLELTAPRGTLEPQGSQRRGAPESAPLSRPGSKTQSGPGAERTNNRRGIRAKLIMEHETREGVLARIAGLDAKAAMAKASGAPLAAMLFENKARMLRDQMLQRWPSAAVE